jgi:hypothetical protein
MKPMRWSSLWVGVTVVGVLLAGQSCGGNPAAPADVNAATHLLHIQPACAGLAANVPTSLWDIPLRLSGTTHLVGASVAPASGDGLAVSVDLQIAGSNASGNVGGRSWIGIPNLLLEISQPGSTGYVATASGTLDSTGDIVGTLNGRLSVIDERTDPNASWVSCDSATHHFELRRMNR